MLALKLFDNSKVEGPLESTVVKVPSAANADLLEGQEQIELSRTSLVLIIGCNLQCVAIEVPNE